MSLELYVMEGATLFAVDMEGRFRQLSEGWTLVHSMAVMEGAILAVQYETIFRVEPATGRDEVHSRGWGEGTKHLAATRDEALLVDGRGRLFDLTLDGRYHFLADTWESVTALAATQGRFFAVDQGRLFEILPDTGAARFVSDGWGEVTAAAAHAGKVYLVTPNHGDLYEVDPDTREERVIGRDWHHTSHMAAADGSLFAMDGRSLFEVRLEDGAVRQISTGWGELQGLAAAGD